MDEQYVTHIVLSSTTLPHRIASEKRLRRAIWVLARFAICVHWA